MSTKVDVFSGFLGAGKTTLIKKLIADGYNNQKIVLIENEFGDIGIDGGFLKESGIEITEMNSGCICCSLVGDFGTALKEVIDTYHPDRILIEPSGVGKLSDVVAAIERVEGCEVCGTVTVIDASKCKIYLKNFAEFYENQIKYAGTIILSRTGNIAQDKLDKAVELIRGVNDHSQIITTPWEQLSGAQIISAIESPVSAEDMAAALLEAEEHEHHHHHHDHDHEHEEHEHDHEHDHDHEEHEHHHDHGEGCTCGCHDHHHHHADEVFDSIGFETSQKFTKSQIEDALAKLDDNVTYGQILRAKGIVQGEDGKWLHFDYVPGESEVREGTSDVTGKLCVIGAEVNKDNVKALFGI